MIMKTTKAKEILEKFNACPESIKWVGDKTAYKAWETCPRGDWLMWIAEKLKVDERKMYLCTALIAHQAIHLMPDRRSREAVRAMFLYGRGKISFEELGEAKYEALIASFEVYGTVFEHAAYAATGTFHADFYVSVAIAYSSTDSTKRQFEIFKKSADICRAVLTDDIKKFF
jgi:hypothetical protein